MPSLATHLGLRPARQTSGGSVSPSSFRLPESGGNEKNNDDNVASSSTHDANTGTPSLRRTPSNSIARVPSRRGSLIARRNSTLANVADKIAEETRTVPDEAFEVPELQVPDPPKMTRQRIYRQPDGTLSQTKPPRNPYTVAARRDWVDLVQYARLNDGDANTTKTGKCFRHGIGVTYPEHFEYLKRMNLEPETNPDGSFIGFDPRKQNPLKDPKHPFHGYVKEFDLRMARQTKRAERREERGQEQHQDVSEDEEDEEEEKASEKTQEPVLPKLPWLTETQRLIVQDEIKKSRQRDAERGGLCPMDMGKPMTI